MKHTPISDKCRKCLFDIGKNRYPKGISEEDKNAYLKDLEILFSSDAMDKYAPEVLYEMDNILRRRFHYEVNLDEEKKYYNALMMKEWPRLEKELQESDDPFLLGLQYAAIGNFIDFALLKFVDEDKIQESFSIKDTWPFDKETIQELKDDITNGKHLVYLTDNCGEVALDKLFIQQIKAFNPQIEITAIVKGYPVLNDATLDDAKMVSLYDVCTVIDNGSRIAGTVMHSISSYAKEIIENADVIISKGMANYETLLDAAYNIYFIMISKCEYFSELFHVPLNNGFIWHNTHQL